jgi:two-component system, sensor histidine kinase and response regulator
LNKKEKTSVIEPFFLVSLEGLTTTLSASNNIFELLGFKAESFLSGDISLQQLIHPEDKDISDLLFLDEPKLKTGSVNVRMKDNKGNFICLKANYKKPMRGQGHNLELILQDAKSLWKNKVSQTFTIEFISMMENTNDYIYFKDCNHVFTSASQTLVNITNPSNHWTDLIGKTDYDVFPQEYADIYYNLEKQVFSGISVAHEIQEILYNSGNKGWIDNRKYPILSEQKKIVGLFGIARDITKSQKVEKTLKLSQKQLVKANQKNEQILNSSGEGIYGLDSNGRTTFVNNAAEMILGYTLSEMQNISQHELIHHSRPDGSPYPREECKIFNAFKTGVAERVSDEYFWKKDGTPFPVEYISTPIVENGKIQGAVVTFSDISSRCESEAALKISEKRFRTIFEECPLGVALINSHTGHIYEVNPRFAEIAGRSLEEMATIDWMSITHPDDIQKDLDNMTALNAGKINGFKMEKRYIRPDDSYVWISMTIAPITVIDKSDPRHLCMIEDITEKKRIEAQLKNYQNHLKEEIIKRSLELQQSQKRLIHSEKLSTLGKFAGTVAHEFNNPLFGVISLIEQMEDGLKDEQEKMFSKLAKKECWRMADMIKNLQSFYKPSDEHFSTITMYELVEEVLLIAGKTCKNKGIIIHKTYKNGKYSFEGIEDQIKQVILNTINNAIESFSEGAGKITLNMAKTSTDILLEIQDTGIGIDEENLNFIFDPFFTTKGKEGTGLGLSVSYGIIKKHGGDILIESELGIGSTVTLVIPVKRKI